MKIKITVLLLALASVSGCILSSSAQDGRLRACKVPLESRCTEERTNFSSSADKIYVSYGYRDGKKDDLYKIHWLREDGSKFAVTQYVLTEDGNGHAFFSLKKPRRGWVPGSYALKLYKEGNEEMLTSQVISVLSP